MSLARTAALVFLPTMTFGAVMVLGSIKPLEAASRDLPTATCVGVMINPILDDVEGGMPQHAFQGTMAETKLALVVESPKGGIVGLAKEGSKVTEFVDSTGKSMLDKNSPFGPFGFSNRILDEGRRLALELDGSAMHSADATWISAKGLIAVRIAHEKGTWTSERTTIAPNSLVDVGPFDFKVLRAEKSTWNDGYEIEVETKDDVSNLTAIVAIDDAGERHELRTTSTMSFMGTTRLTFESESEILSAEIEVEAWKNADTKKVPFRVKVRVGQADG